jgi:hypothetical protein
MSLRRLVRAALLSAVAIMITTVGAGTASADTVWNKSVPVQVTAAPALAQDTVWN